MRWEIELRIEDRDGAQRTCRTNVESSGTIADLVSFADAFGTRVEAISDGHLVGARIHTRVVPSVSTTAGLASDVRRKVLLILKDSAGNVGSLLIPSPGDLPYESTGPYAGYRIIKSDLAPTHPIAQGILSLSTTVRPDELPMPTEDWVIALLSD